MKLYTWGEMKARIRRELSLEDEDFVTDQELNGYGQAAIDEAEQEFMKLYPQYFQAEEALPLVSGQKIYDMPNSIYANKIVYVQYAKGEERYPIRRIRDLEEIAYVRANDYFRYRVVNQSNGAPKIHLYPTPTSNESDTVTLYHLRSANEIVDDTTIVDMPEAHGFIIQHVKDACASKEMGSMYSAPPSPALEKQRSLIQAALSDMIPDADNKIEPNLEFYDDFHYNDFGRYGDFY